MVILFFFFQAEDGIRDDLVTGVQTCALPILIHEDEDIGAERPRGRREREHGLEAWAVPREEDDAAQPGLLRQRHEIVGNARALEADGQGASGPRGHARSPLRSWPKVTLHSLFDQRCTQGEGNMLGGLSLLGMAGRALPHLVRGAEGDADTKDY